MTPLHRRRERRAVTPRVTPPPLLHLGSRVSRAFSIRRARRRGPRLAASAGVAIARRLGCLRSFSAPSPRRPIVCAPRRSPAEVGQRRCRVPMAPCHLDCPELDHLLPTPSRLTVGQETTASSLRIRSADPAFKGFSPRTPSPPPLVAVNSSLARGTWAVHICRLPGRLLAAVRRRSVHRKSAHATPRADALPRNLQPRSSMSQSPGRPVASVGTSILFRATRRGRSSTAYRCSSFSITSGHPRAVRLLVARSPRGDRGAARDVAQSRVQAADLAVPSMRPVRPRR